MTRQRTIRLLLILAMILLAILIVERLWAFGETLQGVLSTLAGAWFLALAVRPFIEALHRTVFPTSLVRWVERRYGAMWSRRMAQWRLPYGLAVAVVYIGLVVVVVGMATIIVAAIIPQATDLINRLPDISARIPSLVVEAWASTAQRFGLNPNAITGVVSTQEISTRATQLAAAAAQQALVIVTGTATLIGQFVLMLILSLYIVTEGKMLQRQAFVLLPESAHEFTHAFIDAVDRAFDSYLRGYIASALLRGAFAVALFGLFGVNFGVVLALVYAILSLIPLIGSPIAILTAGIVTLFVHQDVVLPVVVTLFVFDQIMAYMVVPRIMSDTVGVPGLIGLLSISVGVQLFGFWGLIFSVPTMGAVYTLLFDYYLPRRRKAQGLPEYDPALDSILPYRRTRAPKTLTAVESGRMLKGSVPSGNPAGTPSSVPPGTGSQNPTLTRK